MEDEIKEECWSQPDIWGLCTSSFSEFIRKSNSHRSELFLSVFPREEEGAQHFFYKLFQLLYICRTGIVIAGVLDNTQEGLFCLLNFSRIGSLLEEFNNFSCVFFFFIEDFLWPVD